MCTCSVSSKGRTCPGAQSTNAARLRPATQVGLVGGGALPGPGGRGPVHVLPHVPRARAEQDLRQPCACSFYLASCTQRRGHVSSRKRGTGGASVPWGVLSTRSVLEPDGGEGRGSHHALGLHTSSDAHPPTALRAPSPNSSYFLMDFPKASQCTFWSYF